MSRWLLGEYAQAPAGIPRLGARFGHMAAYGLNSGQNIYFISRHMPHALSANANLAHIGAGLFACANGKWARRWVARPIALFISGSPVVLSIAVRGRFRG